jgi:signal transduction histidine kinase
MERTIRDATPFQRVEADYVTPTGEKRVLGIGASAVRGKKGEILGVSFLIADLTHISELSRQVQLKENLASLGEMSAGIAHEFKNSLATISGYAQMLVQEAASDTGREFAGKIASETESLSRIVTEFLEFARPHGMARQTVNLNAVLEDCAQETGVDLQLPKAPVLEVSGDAVLLRQAISNLLRNSAEASRNGSPVKVSVRGSVEADKLQISLTDNGRGIAAEDLSRIFIPFFTTKATGTGLGLALVHRIISEHGGAITVASDTKGTTFTLTLPANQPAAAMEKE